MSIQRRNPELLAVECSLLSDDPAGNSGFFRWESGVGETLRETPRPERGRAFVVIGSGSGSMPADSFRCDTRHQMAILANGTCRLFYGLNRQADLLRRRGDTQGGKAGRAKPDLRP